jgi:hypothetical protein
MQHLDEGTIHALLDGALPPAEREAAEAHVARCERCTAAVAEARGFIAASSRILTALDAVPGGVLPAARAAVRAPARFTISRAWIAAAAVLMLSTATAIAIRPRPDAAPTRLAEAREQAAAPAPVPAPAPAPFAQPEAPVVASPKPAPSPPVRKRAPTPTPAAQPVVAARDEATRAAAAPPAALGAVVTEALPYDTAAPQLVSRATSTEHGDTVITTVYTLRGVRVSLSDHPSRASLRRSAAAAFSDQVIAKAQESAPENSITWSDSAGRTRTLRGALSTPELERLRATLFPRSP